MNTTRYHPVSPPFSLAATCGPAAWVGDRSPRHRWHGNALTWVGREGETTAWRRVRQPAPNLLAIEGSAAPEQDATWLRHLLGTDAAMPLFTDLVIEGLAERWPGLRPMSDGGLYEGLVTSIVGQSISVAAAAVTQRKLCTLFGPGITLDGHTFHALPAATQIADASPEFVRTSGVTMKRAQAIIAAAHQFANGTMPDNDWARANPEATVTRLLDLPGVGRWTAESTVLWGLGAPDAHPTNDVALLRAAKAAFNLADLTLRQLDDLAEAWRPARGIAARLLWTNLLGLAPET